MYLYTHDVCGSTLSADGMWHLRSLGSFYSNRVSAVHRVQMTCGIYVVWYLSIQTGYLHYTECIWLGASTLSGIFLFKQGICSTPSADDVWHLRSLVSFYSNRVSAVHRVQMTCGIYVVWYLSIQTGYLHYTECIWLGASTLSGIFLFKQGICSTPSADDVWRVRSLVSFYSNRVSALHRVHMTWGIYVVWDLSIQTGYLQYTECTWLGASTWSGIFLFKQGIWSTPSADDVWRVRSLVSFYSNRVSAVHRVHMTWGIYVVWDLSIQTGYLQYTECRWRVAST